MSQEIARKPNARTKVRCTQCQKEFVFDDRSIIEEQMPVPYNTVVEGFLVCPYCGLKTHSYYMPETLRFDLSKLQAAIVAYQKTANPKTYKRYLILHEAYKHNFDKAQAKYKKLLQREETLEK